MSPWRREPGEGPGEGEPPSFSSTCENGLWTIRLSSSRIKGLGCWRCGEETTAEMFIERNEGGEYGAVREASLSFHVICLLGGFSKEGTVIFIL